MKRSIKFRVWDHKLLKFNYFDLLSTVGNFPIDCIDNVQQFTGLFDSEMKEIYEGDIVHCRYLNHNEYTCPVVFSPSCVAFVLDSSGRHLFDDKYGDYLPMHREREYKIVGNIFEK